LEVKNPKLIIHELIVSEPEEHDYCPCNYINNTKYEADGRFPSGVAKPFGFVALYYCYYAEYEPGDKEANDAAYDRNVCCAVCVSHLPLVVLLPVLLLAGKGLLARVLLLAWVLLLAREGLLPRVRLLPGVGLLPGVRLLILVWLRFSGWRRRLVVYVAYAAVAAKLGAVRISCSARTNHSRPPENTID